MAKLSALIALAFLGLSAQAGVGGYVCHLSELKLSGQSNAFILAHTQMEGYGTVSCIQDLDAHGTYIVANGISTPIKAVFRATGIGPMVAHYNSQTLSVFATGINIGSNPNDVFGTYYGGSLSAAVIQPQGGINLSFSKTGGAVGFTASLFFSMIEDGAALGAALQGTDLTLIPMNPGQHWQPIDAN